MELRRHGMARIAQCASFLVGKHMAIGATVGGMTGTAAFYARRGMFEHKRPIFISMACATLRLLEATKLHTFIRLVGIVAGHAAHRALCQPVAFVEVKLRKRVLVTLITNRRCGIHIAKIVGQRRKLQLTVNAVATRAVEPCAPV